MDLSATLSQITALSVDDRIHLVQAIWDSIADEQGQPSLTEVQRNELERRLADHQANPTDVVPWEEVKAAALARRRQ